MTIPGKLPDDWYDSQISGTLGFEANESAIETPTKYWQYYVSVD